MQAKLNFLVFSAYYAAMEGGPSGAIGSLGGGFLRIGKSIEEFAAGKSRRTAETDFEKRNRIWQAVEKCGRGSISY
jgi:hypothetical protein